MRTHPGSKEGIDLGAVSLETRRRLKEVKTRWLEFTPDPPRLLVRPAQPETGSIPREIAGE